MGVANPGRSLWKNIDDYVRNGGGLAVLPGADISLSAYNDNLLANHIIPGKFQRLVELPKRTAFWRTEDLLRRDGQFLRLTRLDNLAIRIDPPATSRYWEVSYDPSKSSPLARYNIKDIKEGPAAMLERKFEGSRIAGKVILLTADLADPADGISETNNFFDTPFHLVLAKETVGYLATARYPLSTAAVRHANRSPSAAELNGNFDQLGAMDAGQAYRAMLVLEAHPTEAVQMLSAHVKPAPAIEKTKVRQLIRELGSKYYAVRQNARKELELIAYAAATDLKQEQLYGRDAEVKRRIDEILKTLQPSDPARLRDQRVVEMLENIATEPARQLLTKLGNGAPDALITRESREAIARIAERDTVTAR
jgi:hypothetical protein